MKLLAPIPLAMEIPDSISTTLPQSSNTKDAADVHRRPGVSIHPVHMGMAGADCPAFVRVKIYLSGSQNPTPEGDSRFPDALNASPH